MTSTENRPPGASERLLHLINILYHICLRWRGGGGVSGLGWNKHIWPRSAGPYRDLQNNICWRRDFQSTMQRRGKNDLAPSCGEKKHLQRCCRFDLLVGCRFCCSAWGSDQLPTGVKEALLIQTESWSFKTETRENSDFDRMNESPGGAQSLQPPNCSITSTSKLPRDG